MLRLSAMSCENRAMADPDMLARIDAHMRRGNELLARIDAHLERGIKDFSPQHLARGAEFEGRLEEHSARSDELIADNTRAHDEWRFSLRQDNLRSERILGEISQSMRRLGDRFDCLEERDARRLEEIGDRINEVRSRTDEFRGESRAYREALWAILDQLRGGGGPAPAAG
jgi:hypothetical protein